MMAVTAGIKGRASCVVTPDKTAKAVGSGALEVFATPMLAALVEEAAWTSIQPYLEEGEGSVGTRFETNHSTPTPVGMTVTAETEVTEVDGRRFVFSFTVSDDAGVIGRGTHERFLVQNEKFMQRCQRKLGAK
ncbi:MAG: thioesterase family protein [Clostridiales bacterium]|nr:thioesterase family protein [Clostridiales bacterium]